MARKEDLEFNIHESYTLIHEYEEILRLSSDPREQARSRRAINKQWELIQGYLDEYILLCEQLHARPTDEILEMLPRFPAYADRLRTSVLHQATADLKDVLRDEGLADPHQAAQTIVAALPANRPLLFRSGLCGGYRLESAEQQYFVAQEFSTDREDLLRALEAAFQSFSLQPYRADQDIEPGHILCKIAAKLQTTLFSVFELTRTQNRNVFLELGIALGLRRPFVLVKEADAEVSPLTQGLDYYNIGSYTALSRELGTRMRHYLLNITRYHSSDALPPAPTPTYILSHGDHDMPPDFCVAIAEELATYGLTPVLLGADNREISSALDAAGITYQVIDDTGKTRLEATTQAIQAARFGVYRIDAACSADSFLAFGLAIGLDRPWLLVSRDGTPLPADVRGLSGLRFRSFAELGTQLSKQFGEFLNGFA